MGARLGVFDVSDVDASIARERDLRGEARRCQTLRARAFAQGFAEAARNPLDAAAWLEVFEEKAARRV